MVCNFPIVAWKRVIVRPLLALLFARLRRRKVVLIQHEWAACNWHAPPDLCPGAVAGRRHRDVLAAGPQRELADDPVMRGMVRKCVLAPLPPNIEAPAEHRGLDAAAAARQRPAATAGW